jgi:hypothetical protein
VVAHNERDLQSVAHMDADGLSRFADEIGDYALGVKSPARDELLGLAAHLRTKAGGSERVRRM